MMGDDVNDLIANGWRLNDEVVAAKRERDEWKARAETAERDLTAARQALTDAERERDEARAEVARLKNVIAPEKSATRTCVVCGTPLSESGPYSQRYCGRSCLEEDG